MKNISKKISLLLCAAVVITSMTALSGCNNADSQTDTNTNSTESPIVSDSSLTTDGASEPAGDAKITDGYYTGSIVGMTCYYHFNEDGTYYGSAFDGGMIDAGTYELTDKSTEYYAEINETDDGRNVVESSKTVSKQTVILTSYKDGSTQEIAFDNDKLCDFVMMGQASHMILEHDASFEYVAENMETPIVIVTLYNGSSDATLTLYHDKSYKDFTGLVGGSGSWEKTADGYTLTKDGTKITLTMKEGGASYVSEDTSAELTDTVAVAGAIEFVSDDIHIDGILGMDGGADGNIHITASNEVAIATMNLPNLGQNDIELDVGTFEVDNSGMFPTYKFTFDKLGEIVTEPDYASATESSIVLNLPFKADGSIAFVLMGNDMNLTFDAIAKYTYTIGSAGTAEETVNAENTAVSVSNIPGMDDSSDAKMNLVLTSDGAVTLKCDILGQTDLELDKGTYAVGGEGLPEYTFNFEKLGEFKTSMDMDVTPTETSVGLKVTIAADGTAKFLEDMVPDGAGLTFEAEFKFVHSIG